MHVLAVLAAFLGASASAKVAREGVDLQKSGKTELEAAQRVSLAAKRDLSDARAEFDALVAEAQLPPGIQIPPGWVVIDTAPKPPPSPVVEETKPSAPKVGQAPALPRALVAASPPMIPGTNVVSSGMAKVVLQDQAVQGSTPAPGIVRSPPLPANEVVRPPAIPQALPQKAPKAPAKQQQTQNATQQQNATAPAPALQVNPAPAPAPAPCWAPGPGGAPAGAPGAADVKADELAGPHEKTPEDDYVPALEGVLVPPAGEAAPVTSAQVVVPPNTLSKIQSVECLEKTLENPEYKCADHHYVGGAPPPQAAVQKDSKKKDSGGASAADIEAINDAVKKAEHAAADAKAEAAMAEKYFNEAKEIADRVSKKSEEKKKEGEAKPSSFLRHPSPHQTQHHRKHHEVKVSKQMPILIHAKSPIVFHNKRPQN